MGTYCPFFLSLTNRIQQDDRLTIDLEKISIEAIAK
jgi:hypothetical protein